MLDEEPASIEIYLEMIRTRPEGQSLKAAIESALTEVPENLKMQLINSINSEFPEAKVGIIYTDDSAIIVVAGES